MVLSILTAGVYATEVNTITAREDVTSQRALPPENLHQKHMV